MFNISQDIQSLTDFKRHTANFMKQIKRYGRPVVLTVNGKAELVIQDPNSYQKLLELADRFEAISAIQEGMAQSKRGEAKSLTEFDKHMRKRHGISR